MWMIILIINQFTFYSKTLTITITTIYNLHLMITFNNKIIILIISWEFQKTMEAQISLLNL